MLIQDSDFKGGIHKAITYFASNLEFRLHNKLIINKFYKYVG